MEFWQFVRDKSVFIMGQVLGYSLLLLFFYFLLPTALIMGIFFVIIFFTCGMLPLVREYYVKKHYYKMLYEELEQLDRKNLLTEIISPPTFVEAEILVDLLKNANKEYLDEISRYRHQEEEYREYIELWIHEIKTPIASAMLTIENQGGTKKSPLLEDLTAIENYAMQALFYARSNSVVNDFSIQSLSLQDICFKLLRENARKLIEYNISIQTENLEGTVRADPKWLLYILEQLLSNAIKYRKPSDAQIIFRSEQRDQATVLLIEDNGKGIPKEDLPRVFRKGFTGVHGRNYEKSTGMGLFLCRQLCDKLGLGIDISSEGLEKGTTVMVIFPFDSHVADVI